MVGTNEATLEDLVWSLFQGSQPPPLLSYTSARCSSGNWSEVSKCDVCVDNVLNHCRHWVRVGKRIITRYCHTNEFMPCHFLLSYLFCYQTSNITLILSTIHTSISFAVFIFRCWQESDALKEFRDAELTSLNRVDETNASLGETTDILNLLSLPVYPSITLFIDFTFPLLLFRFTFYVLQCYSFAFLLPSFDFTLPSCFIFPLTSLKWYIFWSNRLTI